MHTTSPRSAKDVDSIHFSEVDSTQSYAEREYHRFAQNRVTAITADFQTAGRGSGTRQWFMPHGCGVLATFYLRLPMELVQKTPMAWRNTRRVLAASAVQVLRDATVGFEGLAFGVKWPNDIILNGQKIGGILATPVAGDVDHPDFLDGVILGIGININNTRENLNLIDRPIWPATSVLAETLMEAATQFDVAAIRAKLISRFHENILTFLAEGMEPLLPLLTRCQILNGMRIAFTERETGTVFFGKVADIDELDRLVLLTEGGGEERFFFGDVRPDDGSSFASCNTATTFCMEAEAKGLHSDPAGNDSSTAP